MVFGAGEQVVEPVRLEDHGDQVGLIRYIDRHEPVLQQRDRLPKPLSQVVEASLCLVELGLLLGEFGGRHRSLVAEFGDLLGEPVDLGGLVADPGREDPGVLLGMRELLLRGVQLLLEVLARGGTAHGDRAGTRRQGAGKRQHQPLGSRHLSVKG
jgi:hypothetical protein